MEYETKASKQVELLLVLTEEKQALVKAIESGDSDLVYDVILKLMNSMDLAKFKVCMLGYCILNFLCLWELPFIIVKFFFDIILYF